MTHWLLGPEIRASDTRDVIAAGIDGIATLGDRVRESWDEGGAGGPWASWLTFGHDAYLRVRLRNDALSYRYRRYRVERPQDRLTGVPWGNRLIATAIAASAGLGPIYGLDVRPWERTAGSLTRYQRRTDGRASGSPRPTDRPVTPYAWVDESGDYHCADCHAARVEPDGAMLANDVDWRAIMARPVTSGDVQQEVDEQAAEDDSGNGARHAILCWDCSDLLADAYAYDRSDDEDDEDDECDCDECVARRDPNVQRWLEQSDSWEGSTWSTILDLREETGQPWLPITLSTCQELGSCTDGIRNIGRAMFGDDEVIDLASLSTIESMSHYQRYDWFPPVLATLLKGWRARSERSRTSWEVRCSTRQALLAISWHAYPVAVVAGDGIREPVATMAHRVAERRTRVVDAHASANVRQLALALAITGAPDDQEAIRYQMSRGRY